MSSGPSPGPGNRGEGVSPRDGDDWGQEAVLDELMAAFGYELGQTAPAGRSDQVPECMDAGFLPRGRAGGPAITNLARGGRGTGFASGAELDTALPGPALAGFADAAAGSDRAYTDLDDDELIGTLTAWQKTEAWAASGKLSAVAELIRRRPLEAGTSDGSAGAPVGWGKFCSDELAVALASSQRAAERMLGVAYDLAFRLPRTTLALSEGLIDSYKAQIIAEATRVLDDAGAAAAESLVLADVAGKTPGQIRAMIGRAVLRVDPDAARQRREQAQRDARVELWREDVGTAALCGFGLPPDEALAADQMISSRALELKAAGMAGTMDQLRVRAYLDVLLGQDSSPVLAGQDSSARQSTVGAGPAGAEGQSPAGAEGQSPAGAEGQSPADNPADTPDGAADEPGSPHTGAAGADASELPNGNQPGGGSSQSGGGIGSGPAVGIAAQINMTVPLATLLGLAERPGEVAGFGPLDPALARAMAAAAATHPATTWCLTVTDRDGHATAHGCARPTRHIGGTRPGDRTDPDSGTGGQTTGPAPPGISPPGGGGRRGPRVRDGRPDNRPSSGDGGYGIWRLRPVDHGPDLTINLEPLAVSDCDHRHETSAHDPGDKLRHLIHIRDGECTWGPCRRSARRCDFEHAIPWEAGGRTCACNAGARCRHHHRQKQAPGWQLTQHLPGYHTWTTPSGRQYKAGPTSYPV
jgi:Domain of unknown function (DUF222)